MTGTEARRDSPIRRSSNDAYRVKETLERKGALQLDM
jgi:hypothetical protein